MDNNRTSADEMLLRLHALERCYDGPLPAGALAALGAGAAELSARAAAADGILLDRLVRDAALGRAAARRHALPAGLDHPPALAGPPPIAALRQAALARRAGPAAPVRPG